MAARRKYRTPLQQLHDLLIDYRTMGLTFDEAWSRARRPTLPIARFGDPRAPDDCVLWPRDRTDSRIWINAIDSSKEGWRRAYDRRPTTPGEEALARLGEWLPQMQLGAVEELDAAESVGSHRQAAVA